MNIGPGTFASLYDSAEISSSHCRRRALYSPHLLFGLSRASEPMSHSSMINWPGPVLGREHHFPGETAEMVKHQDGVAVNHEELS